MKVKALMDKVDITKGKIYEVVNKLKLMDTTVCVKDDANCLHWLTFGNYEIINEPTLKEQYLVSGNVVETRESNKYLVVENSIMNFNGESFIRKTEVKDDLTGVFYPEFDFVKVYKTTNPTAFTKIEKYGELELIWQREPEIKEVTMEELEKHYGCKVKVVK